MTFFTICIPTYNRERYIIRTLESVRAQKFKDYEIIVVDDGSTDCTHHLIKEYKKKYKVNIKYIYKNNGGKHTAIEQGISHAKGKFFLILDSDDILLEDTLSKMHEMIVDNPGFQGVIGKTSYFDGKKIGMKFSEKTKTISYIDFHFGQGFTFTGNKYGDCCECNLTKNLKMIKFPKDDRTKFIPESYLFDRLGTEHRLLVTNQVFMKKEYLEEGITSNKETYYKKNMIGFLYKYVDNIETIIVKHHIPIYVQMYCWMKYWEFKFIDKNNIGPQVERITNIGYMTKILYPLFFLLKKIIKSNNSRLLFKK